MPSKQAVRSVDYLLRTDALSSRDYRAEIEREIDRCMEGATVALRADLEALAVTARALWKEADVLADDGEYRALGLAVDAMDEALARPGVHALLEKLKQTN